MLRNRYLLLSDAILLFVGTLFAFAIRFESLVDIRVYLAGAVAYLLLTVPVRLGVFWLAGIYRRLWRYAGMVDLARLVTTAFVAGVANLLLGAVILPMTHLMAGRVSLSVLVLDGAMTIGLPALLRLVQRQRDGRRSGREAAAAGPGKPILIAGAGEAGRMIANEIRQNPSLQLRVVGFLDDDLQKRGQEMLGFRILGSTAEMGIIARQTGAAELIIAIPTASGRLIRDISMNAAKAGLPTRTVPSLFEVMSGRVAITDLRKVEISDLLRREPIRTDLGAVRALVQGRRVLVTGAGGSIGSELCLQLASFGPAQLALMGHGENSIFDIHNELGRRFPEVSALPMICDVRERERLQRIFEWFRPQLVFHAAAHKHVPLMEMNPNEAVTNNVMGTRNVVELSRQVGAERFLMVSTDKVVRPTSVMGASKRIAEQIVQHLGSSGETKCLAVRFGNVLGSRGSVVPLFMEQISRGAPITITHPQVRRFFMTIPESVQLLLQAMTMGEGGEVFALDMGEPVRIADLAHDLITLSGLEPESDIPIIYTGLRPGEKLYEEVFFDQESAELTRHPKVLKSRMNPPAANLLCEVDQLISMAQSVAEPDVVRRALQRLVPDFVLADSPEATPVAAHNSGEGARSEASVAA